ncbi:hypothetical protein M404DRAFT_593189 [Pisolithus tinctorius Marx 270]|uniref:Uncharacterized protein n=1 Tax=Pisolithus tinctorius Marx 270 TaxID=870435 RepID=A0A0C3KVS5_PISTI|nr:hypothetical protein M404DRAFT_593189 [Pisolithus tinctorius Marx 270]
MVPCSTGPVPPGQITPSSSAVNIAGPMVYSMPPEGLKVMVRYNPLKFEGPPKKDIIKVVIDDLEHLRVHLPARKNIWRRGDKCVTLHWPMSHRTVGNFNSLYSRWIKLSRGDESKRLLKSLLM